MQNVVFNVYTKPVVDKDKKVRYRFLKITKRSGKKEEELLKGRLFTFLSSQGDRVERVLQEGQKFLIPIPVDFLLLKSQIASLNLKRYNFLLGNPVGKFTRKHLLQVKKLLDEYLKGGLEISFEAQTYDRYRFQFPPKLVSFVCKDPQWETDYHKNCIRNVDDEETFERVKEKGDFFCGKLFGDFELSLEITALSFLKTAIVKALELTEREDVSISDLEKVIKSDPKLTVSLLKYANSPLLAPPSPIRDLKHALVYIGLNRIKQYLTVLMLHDLAAVDKDFEEIALRLAAVGMLLEERGREKGLLFSPCQLLLAGIVLEASKLFKKDPSQILQMLEVPSHCPVPLEDKRISELYKELKETEITKMVMDLKKILAGEA